jgi:hypothetical protein
VGKIAGQYGSSTGQKQRHFGRVDPFCLFAVIPLVIVAGVLFWSGIAILGAPLIVLALLIVVVDSWANRPVRTADRYHEDSDPPGPSRPRPRPRTSGPRTTAGRNPARR